MEYPVCQIRSSNSIIIEFNQHKKMETIMIKTRNLNLAKVRLLITGLLLGLSFCHQAQAASASANPADASNKHIYVDQYDLSTNLWGISGAGTNWSETIFTNSTSTMDGAGYKWTGFGGDTSTVKSYPSIRRGASNSQNNPATSGLPYQFGANTKNVDVLWSFATAGYDGTGNIVGTYNHAIDVFFHSSNIWNTSYLKGEIMVIPDSSANSQTAGWGVKDAASFVLDGETWDVWQATMTSNGNSWPVMQFRKRVNARYFNKNLKFFFAEAARRRADVFKSTYYVMTVEAGTEVKSGSGHFYNKNYQVSVY
ncbi:hypothetical protein [Undibacterium sp. YM2]|uniref:hypothetical protein n=1 Tax=Undibacterium sp. YM2 TaxID=2058625 RepID=UPI00138A526E|nr:hypothetical protein [Undibacterium sp. YM2]